MPAKILIDAIKQYRTDQRGAVFVMFALGLVVMAGAVGVAIDYGRGVHARTQLASAADAAALAAAKRAEQLANDGTPQAEAKQQGEAYGLEIWNANISGTSANFPHPTIRLSNTSWGWTAHVNFTGTVDTTVAAVMGINEMDIGGAAEARTGSVSPNYIDFYLLLDNSQSMGVGTTVEAMDRLANETVDKCQFACHLSNRSPDSYTQAKELGIPMRIDTLREATIRMINRAKDTAQKPDQYRIGLWTFDDKQNVLVAPTDDYSVLEQAAQSIDLPGYEDGTKIDDALAYLNNQVTKNGTGSTADDPKKFAFIITDGVQDGIYIDWEPPNDNKVWGTGFMSPTACDALKAKGITVAVLHTVFFEFSSPGDEYQIHIEPIKDDIKNNLIACASPNYYFEAQAGPEIEPALEKMFETAIGRVAGNLRLSK